MADVLVVDDEPQIRRLLAETIEEEGHTAAVASDGLEALSLIADGLRPQLVITDLRMPHLSGIELAATIRARSPRAAPAIALMSADHQWLDDVEGVVSKLSKPFEIGAVVDLVEAHCGPARHQASS